MNAAPMGQCIDPMMMTARLCLARNVICKCQGFIAHLGLYSRVAAGAVNNV
jgi:hypothetical protein